MPSSSGTTGPLTGRSKAGFAILTGSERTTFDEREHRVEWDGKALVNSTRSRAFEPALGSAPPSVSPWSAWTKDPLPSP